MYYKYNKYQVSFENKAFRTPAGRIFSKTAILTFFDSSGNESDSLKFGCPDLKTIYDDISKGSVLDLDHCYVNGFSMTVYRQINDLAKNHLVTVKSILAREAFFDSHFATDFSYSCFEETVSFEGTCFGRGKVTFNNSCFMGKADFSSATFQNGSIEFNSCRFEDVDFIFKNSIIGDGLKDFSDIRFGKGEVNFANTEFNYGDLLFINTRFNDGKVNFKVARIAGGRVDFHFANFGKGEVIFERTEFGDSKVDFRAVDFGEGKVNFNRSVFGVGDINFEGASCHAGRILFKRSVIGVGKKNFNLLEMENAELNFEKTLFGSGDLSFEGSRFNKLVLKSCYLNHYVDLRIDSAGYVDLSDTIVRDIIDLETYDHKIDIRTINLAGMRLIGKIYIDWDKNCCKCMIDNQMSETSNRQKAEQFRILKVNFNQTGKYDDEDEAYIMFKRFQARAIVDDYSLKGSLMKVYGLIANGFRWLIFDAAGLYATNPLRVLLSMGVSYLFFSIVFYVQIKFTNADIISSTTDYLADLPRAFYHSAITFFTIGYGDHYPHGAIRIVSGLEGFVGVFLMAYFTVAFVRKVLR